MDMVTAGDEEATTTPEESMVDGCVKLLTNVLELAEEKYRNLSQNQVRVMILGFGGHSRRSFKTMENHSGFRHRGPNRGQTGLDQCPMKAKELGQVCNFFC